MGCSRGEREDEGAREAQWYRRCADLYQSQLPPRALLPDLGAPYNHLFLPLSSTPSLPPPFGQLDCRVSLLAERFNPKYDITVLPILKMGIEQSPTSQTTPASVPPSVFTLPHTAQLEALYTIIRDKTTSRGDFLFYSDRIIRLLVEEGLNHLPVVPKTVETPTVST